MGAGGAGGAGGDDGASPPGQHIRTQPGAGTKRVAKGAVLLPRRRSMISG